jgi:hypothetical protein
MYKVLGDSFEKTVAFLTLRVHAPVIISFRPVPGATKG